MVLCVSSGSRDEPAFSPQLLGPAAHPIPRIKSHAGVLLAVHSTLSQAGGPPLTFRIGSVRSHARAPLAGYSALPQPGSPPFAFRICSVRSHARAQLAGSLAYLLPGSRLAVLPMFSAFGP